MNQRVVKHLLQVFLIPAAGIGLAWYGNQLPLKDLGDFGSVEWSVLALFLVGMFELICWTLTRLSLMIALGLGLMVTIVGLPLNYYAVTSTMPGFGNLLEYVTIIFGLFVLALITLRYRVDIRMERHQDREQFISINGRFE